MTSNKAHKINPKDILIFNSTYLQAGGTETFPNLIALGSVKLEIRLNNFNIRNETLSLTDLVTETVITIPIELTETIYGAKPEQLFDTTEYSVKTGIYTIIKRALAEMNTNYIFDAKLNQREPFLFEGDSYILKNIRKK